MEWFCRDGLCVRDGVDAIVNVALQFELCEIRGIADKIVSQRRERGGSGHADEEILTPREVWFEGLYRSTYAFPFVWIVFSREIAAGDVDFDGE